MLHCIMSGQSVLPSIDPINLACESALSQLPPAPSGIAEDTFPRTDARVRLTLSIPSLGVSDLLDQNLHQKIQSSWAAQCIKAQQNIQRAYESSSSPLDAALKHRLSMILQQTWSAHLQVMAHDFGAMLDCSPMRTAVSVPGTYSSGMIGDSSYAQLQTAEQLNGFNKLSRLAAINLLKQVFKVNTNPSAADKARLAQVSHHAPTICCNCFF